MMALIRAAVEAQLGVRPVRDEPVLGGDINEAYRVELADGRRVFVKTNSSADPRMFEAEARGLAFLAEAGALRVPRVLAASSTPPFLVLEYLESAPRVSDFDIELGRSLAALHRFGAPTFGLDHDNFMGRLPAANGPKATWPEFYAERRLLPQLRLATESGRASRRMISGIEAVASRLTRIVGSAEPPSRLHGDLWGGNLHADDHGLPCLIDPAVYGGHREVDLAMMKLFGGFSERCFAAYEEAWPLPTGHEERVSLYQLYPLLVHVNLFGGSYVRSVERAIERCP